MSNSSVWCHFLTFRQRSGWFRDLRNTVQTRGSSFFLFQSPELKNQKHKTPWPSRWQADQSPPIRVAMSRNQNCVHTDGTSVRMHVSSGAGRVPISGNLRRSGLCLCLQVCRGISGVTVFNVYMRLYARVNFLQGQQGAQLLSLSDRALILNWLNVEHFDAET